MGKIIFWLMVVFAVLLVLRLINVANSRAANGKATRGSAKPKDTTMTRCVNCGVYLPRADAVEGPRGHVCGDPQCLPRETRKRG